MHSLLLIIWERLFEDSVAVVLVTWGELVSVGRHDGCHGGVFHWARKHHLAILLLALFTTDPVDQAMLLLLRMSLLLLFVRDGD